MHRYQRLLVCLFLLLTLTAAGPARLLAETKPSGALGVSVAEVFAAWEARAEQLRSFEATWNQREYYRRDSLPGREAPRAGERRAYPEEDTTVDMDCELRLSGDRFYVRRSGLQWLTELSEFVESEQVAALDQGVGTLFGRTAIPVVEPRAHVLPEDRFRESRSVSNLPLFLTLRPRSEKLRPVDRDGAWSVAPVTAEVDGHPCVMVERLTSVYNPKLAKGELRETYWVDPARDFCVRRFERTLGGLVELQIEIAYADPTHAWLPTSWRSVVFGGPDAVPTRQYDARLLSHAVNGELPAERLQANLPAGTAVENVATSEAWIVLPEGRRRVVTLEERQRGASYAQLLASEPGQAALPPWQPWRTMAGIAAMILAFVGVGSRWRAKSKASLAHLALAKRPAPAPWLTILALGSALSLGTFAAGLTEAAATVCAGRCQGGVWSAYKQGTAYRMDFLKNCMYRAWSNDVTVSYAPSNSCASGYVQIPYYLYITSWTHPCFTHAPAGDLLWTMDLGGSYVGIFNFPCCDGLCYGLKT